MHVVPDAPAGASGDSVVSAAHAAAAPVARDGGSWRPRPVRVALLVTAMEQPAWVRHALAEAIAGRWAEVVVTAVVDAGEPGGDPERHQPARQSGAYGAYLRLDAGRYQPENDPERLADLAPALGGAPVVRVQPADGAAQLTPADLDAVRAYGADIALDLGVALRGPAAAHVAADGVWALDYYHQAGALGVRPPVRGFWEVARGLPVTESALRCVTGAAGAAGDRVLARARSSTQRISVTVNRAEHAWHVAHLLGAALRRFSQGGPAAVADEPGPDAGPTAPAAERVPTVTDVARLAARVATRLVLSRANELRSTREWYLAYHLAPDDATVQHAVTGSADRGVPELLLERFTELLPPPDRYWADPFPVAYDGRYYVFFEEHLYGERDAHLSVAELDPGAGVLRDARMVLRRDYHLSWPSVFQWQGAWYMTPETMTRRAVELHRASRFPDGWEYVGDLVAGDNFVDASIAEVDGRWWMFVGVMPHGASEASALHVYHADTPLGPWTPHARNPVAVDVRGARPAGRVYRHGGAYYRPVQDGAPYYGSATNVHRIDALTPAAFRETPVARVAPRWKPGLLGVHTLNAAGRLTVTDVLRRVPRRPPGARG